MTLPLVLIGKGKTERCEKSQFGFTNSIDNFFTPDEENPEMAQDANEIVMIPIEDDANEEETENEDEDENPNPMNHVTTHSVSGWVNATIWKKYLHFLRAQIPIIPGSDPNEERNTIFLICDGFQAHHNDEAQNEAKKLNIALIAVPNGATDECQPLDRRIFGALKSRLRSELNRHISAQLVLLIQARQAPDANNNPLLNAPIEMPHFTKRSACELLIRLWDSMPQYQVLNGWQIAIYGKEETEDA